jgi:dihydrofolate reductase
MKLSIIAAVGQNNELGKDNNLIWHLKKDMQFFQKTTTGHILIMGRKTFESLPKILPNRQHLVLSRKDLNLPKEVKVYHDIAEFLNDYKNCEDEIFNIGGAKVYEELLPYADQLYLTEIAATDKTANVFFPNFPQEDFVKEILDTDIDEKTNISFKHTLYKRRIYGKR